MNHAAVKLVVTNMMNTQIEKGTQEAKSIDASLRSGTEIHSVNFLLNASNEELERSH